MQSRRLHHTACFSSAIHLSTATTTMLKHSEEHTRTLWSRKTQVFDQVECLYGELWHQGELKHYCSSIRSTICTSTKACKGQTLAVTPFPHPLKHMNELYWKKSGDQNVTQFSPIYSFVFVFAFEFVCIMYNVHTLHAFAL